MNLPKPSPNLVLQEVGNDVIVYEPRLAKAHLLNETMVLVMKACQGVITEQQMLEHLQVAPGVEPEVLVQMVVAELQSLELLEADPQAMKAANEVARRDFIKMATVAAAPLVLSVVAPMPAAATSLACVGDCIGAPVGSPCDPSAGADCSSGFLCMRQYTCNGIAGQQNFTACRAGSSCASGDFPNPDLLCVHENGTSIQVNCTQARLNAQQTLQNQGSYICRDCV